MRRAAYTLGLIAMVLGALWVCGCSGGGSDGPVNELGWRWAINDPVTVNDAGTENTSHNVDPTTPDSASITFKLESNANVETDLWIHTFSAQISTSATGAPVLPVGTFTVNRWLPAKGGTLTLTWTFLSAANKSAYINAFPGGTLPDGFSANYYINFSVYGSYSKETGDNDVTIDDDTWFTVIKAPTATPTPTPTP